MKNLTLSVTSPTSTGSTTSPRDTVVALLNSNRTRLGFSRVDSEYLIFFVR